MSNGDQGIPCPDCTAHSGHATATADIKQEVKCLRKRFDEIDEAKDRSHGLLHKRITEVMRAKISLKLFMWVVGGVLGSMVLVSGFMWNGIKALEDENRVFHKEVGDKMTDISVDLRVIKSELKK